MNENIAAWIREQRFGHIIAQTEIGETFSLDLFETPDLVASGFYLPAPAYSAAEPWVGQIRRLDISPLPEVELRASEQAMDELRRGIAPEEEEGEGLRRIHASTRSVELYGTLNPTSRRQGVEVWTGRVLGTGDLAPSIRLPDAQPEMVFVLERYGSPEVVLMIVAIFQMIYRDQHADELDDICFRRALDLCGYEGVKRVRTKRRFTSLANPGGGEHDCEIECA